jgi:hypothetical protein
MFFLHFLSMECQGSFLGLATNTTRKCLDARKPLQEYMHINAIYKMGLTANAVKSRETHHIWDTLC